MSAPSPIMPFTQRGSATTPAPRAVTGMGGQPRWACRACGKSHATRARAATCCMDQVLHPPAVKGGELILPGHRTHEQVVEQLEARMQELEKQAAELKKIPPDPYPCAECKWADGHRCVQPLVKGFDPKLEPNVDYQSEKGWFPSPRNWPNTLLCGREKALWEPNLPPPLPPLTRWQHLIKAIFW